MSAEPTPRPWSIDPTDLAVIWGPDDLRIASLKGSTIIAGEDNAEYIVLAVNAHDELIAALDDCYGVLAVMAAGGIGGEDARDVIQVALNALQKARGES